VGGEPAAGGGPGGRRTPPRPCGACLLLPLALGSSDTLRGGSPTGRSRDVSGLELGAFLLRLVLTDWREVAKDRADRDREAASLRTGDFDFDFEGACLRAIDRDEDLAAQPFWLWAILWPLLGSLLCRPALRAGLPLGLFSGLRLGLTVALLLRLQLAGAGLREGEAAAPRLLPAAGAAAGLPEREREAAARLLGLL